MEINYFARYSQQKTERQVEPVGVFYSDNCWHLIAYCRMRSDYRDFRFDRISAMDLTKIPFSKVHATLKEYLEETEKKGCKNQNQTLVIIRIDKIKSFWLETQKYYQGFISQTEHGDEIEMTFLSASPSGFARWFLMFGDHAKIIEPEALKEEVRSLISSISSRLDAEQRTRIKEQGLPQNNTGRKLPPK